MKIDTSKIENYETMSAEEKLKALEAFEYEDKSEELEKHKKRIDELTSEIAKKNKEAKAKEDADKKAKDEGDEKYNKLEQMYNELKAESTTNKYVSALLAQGYEKDLAVKKAKAMVEGDIDTVFECETQFKEALEKKIKADAVKSTPKPDDKGSSKIYKTKEEIMKIKDSAERQKAISEHLDLFE